MNTAKRLLTMTLICGVAIGGFAQAQDAVVPDDFDTIAGALAGAFDTNFDGTVDILVRPGTYVEDIRIERSDLTLRGEDAATTVLQGTGAIDALQVRDAGGVMIATMTVVGVDAGLQFNAIDFNRVTASRIDGVITEAGDSGINISNSEDCVVLNSDTSGAVMEGIKIHRSSRIDLAFNVSHDNGQQGFNVDESDTVRMGRNEATGNFDSGFRDRFSNGNLYVQNTSSGNVINGWRIENSSGTTLRRNTALGNQQNGLRMDTTSNSQIFGNRFVNNFEWGVRRKDWFNDDFDASQVGIQNPAGDNNLSGNIKGEVRND